MVKEVKHRSRRVAALLAIVFVGMFGAHKFYIGNKQAGVIHIIVLFVAAFVGIFSCVEGIIYALKSDEEFDEQYVYGGRAFL